MKKKRINIFKVLLVLVLLIAIAMGILILFNGNKIKENYSKYVIVSTDTKLYNSKKKSIGKIYKNSYLELDKYESGKYFKIKDSDYYVYYSDVKKTKKSLVFFLP